MTTDAALAMDERDRGSREKLCQCCGKPSRRTWCTITRDGHPYAVYLAYCYSHDQPETWIDVIFGTWDQDGIDDHVTFGCKLQSQDLGSAPVSTLVDAASVFSDDPLYGQKLSPAGAQQHPLLAQFWKVVELIKATDPLVRSHHHANEGIRNSTRPERASDGE